MYEHDGDARLHRHMRTARELPDPGRPWMEPPTKERHVKETVVNIITAMVMLAVAVPIFAVIIGLSVRLYRWLAG